MPHLRPNRGADLVPVRERLGLYWENGSFTP